MNTKAATLDDLNDILEQVGVREPFIPTRDRSGSPGCYYLRATIFAVSADLADGFISKLGKPKSRGTIREPLAVLGHVGILKRAHPAINDWRVKTPTLYVVDRPYVGRRAVFAVDLPLYLATNRELAFERCESRRNRRYPFRAQLLTDLGKLSFDPESRRRIAEVLGHPDFGTSAKRAIEAVDGAVHWVRVSPRGQITTSVSGCPKALKAFLLLEGEAVVFYDICHAYRCFLPALLGGRIDHLRKKHGSAADISHYEAELKRLIQFLGNGDYYSKWCRDTEDPVEREEKKLLLTMILNWPNAKCEGNALYRRMRQAFPLTFRICEDIKRKDHRNISKSLQHLTAKAINGALLEAQAKGIVAIPDADAIICPKRHKKPVCALIGQHVYEVWHGVCCKVGGVRYDSCGADVVTATAGSSD